MYSWPKAWRTNEQSHQVEKHDTATNVKKQSYDQWYTFTYVHATTVTQAIFRTLA